SRAGRWPFHPCARRSPRTSIAPTVAQATQLAPTTASIFALASRAFRDLLMKVSRGRLKNSRALPIRPRVGELAPGDRCVAQNGDKQRDSRFALDQASAVSVLRPVTQRLPASCPRPSRTTGARSTVAAPGSAAAGSPDRAGE